MKLIRRVSGRRAHLNCKLFVLREVGVDRLEDIPVVSGPPRAGDVLQWGTPATHWALSTGGDGVREVPEWGEEPQQNRLSSIQDDYDLPMLVRRPQRGQRNAGETVPFKYTRVPRYMAHCPFGRPRLPDGGIKAFPLHAGRARRSETEALKADLQQDGFGTNPQVVWLSKTPGSKSASCLWVDLNKLDLTKLVPTFTGSFLYVGDIPVGALKECPDCEWQDEDGIWRTGVCDDCKRLESSADCANCQGTGSPICCRCEGTHVDLNP